MSVRRSAALLEASVALRRLDTAAARKSGGGFAPEASERNDPKSRLVILEIFFSAR